MITVWPLTLFVDDISPDKTRATVSDPYCVMQNMLAFIKMGLVPAPLKPATIQGIHILATGKYVCLIVKSANDQYPADGMVFLDLLDRADVTRDIARKFDNARLEKKFLQTVDYILNNPDTHSRVLLVPNPRNR